MSQKMPKTQALEMARNLTVIIPAYNEAENIKDTVVSIQYQTTPPKEIIVVDDFSSDATGEIARSLGVTVVRPPQNTGSKAGAQNFALESVKTEFSMAVDADTVLAPDAIELLLSAFDDRSIAAACGFVVPRFVSTLWERGRYIEYLFAFTFYKPIQDYFKKPLISSGCFSVYRTGELKANGGWSLRTMAEDMDLTWSFYQQGFGVRFIPEAVCYPIEPHNFLFMKKQLRRWSHGFIQNVMLHWRGILSVPYLRSAVAVSIWDATIASIGYLIFLPVMALLFQQPFFFLLYFIDAPVLMVPILLKAIDRKETLLALKSFPSFFVLRIVNSIFILEAFLKEVILGARLTTYEKGH